MLIARVCLTVLIPLLRVVEAQQHLYHGHGQVPLGTGLNPPAPSLLRLSNVVSSSEYTTLSHARFPGHNIRVKKIERFCDPTVNVYTGYLDIDDGSKHLFFSFFESRRDPENDDLMMWINGGPGCSSSLGLLMELGPCSIDMKNSSSNGTTWNPYSWNEKTNIFFLDQPVGVGFSYASHASAAVETTEQAAKDIYAFFSIFYKTFDAELRSKKLHLAGESYAGRYLPVFASEIIDQNALALKEGRKSDIITLESVIIGNGITDISTLYQGRFEIECRQAAFDVPFQTIKNCVRMQTALPRCDKRMKEACIEHFDSIDCRAAVAFCDAELSTAMWESGRNVYDISKTCAEDDDLCYAENNFIKAYLDLPSTRALLGIDESQLNTSFSACSSTVGSAFASHLDKWAVPTQYYVAGLLDRGVKVLIYAGTYDWQCNWVANKLWVEKLEWSGREEFVKDEWRVWGDGAGEVKGTDGKLVFATVRGAGHMVPHDRPKEALALIGSWVDQIPL